MDGSKKSSFTSSNTFMSANEDIEMDSMPASTSDLNKFIKRESKAETINEEIKETEMAVDENVDVDTPLLLGGVQMDENNTPIPMSPSDLDRLAEIEQTFQINGDYRDEQVSLVHSMATSVDNNLDNIESQQRPINRNQSIEMFLTVQFLRLVELARDYWKFVIAGVLLAVFSLVALVLLPKCFHSLYYDEYALARSSLTGKVDDKWVYEPGWHLMSPFNEWIIFKKTVHSVQLNNLQVYTTDQLMVKTSFEIYYFLDKDSIGKLYRKLGDQYRVTIYKVCLSSVINSAQEFSISQFRSNRNEIKNHIKSRLTTKLRDEYGIEVFDLYLKDIDFDRVINALNLKRIMNVIWNEKALADKKTAIIYAETDVLVVALRNEAFEITENANNKGEFEVMKIEQTNYDRSLEMTHIEGLKANLEGLDIEDVKHKMSFCWVNSLVYNDKIRMYQNNRVNETSVVGYGAFNAAVSMML